MDSPELHVVISSVWSRVWSGITAFVLCPAWDRKNSDSRMLSSVRSRIWSIAPRSFLDQRLIPRLVLKPIGADFVVNYCSGYKIECLMKNYMLIFVFCFSGVWWRDLIRLWSPRVPWTCQSWRTWLMRSLFNMSSTASSSSGKKMWRKLDVSTLTRELRRAFVLTKGTVGMLGVAFWAPTTHK